MTLEQTGSEIIVYNKNYNIVIKKLLTRKDNQYINKIKIVHHRNIVDLWNAFIKGLNMCFMYEFILVILPQIQDTAWRAFQSFEIAALCKEVCMTTNLMHSAEYSRYLKDSPLYIKSFHYITAILIAVRFFSMQTVKLKLANNIHKYQYKWLTFSIN